VHREHVQAGGTFALREPSESYTGKFVGENDALTPETQSCGKKIVKLPGHSVVRPREKPKIEQPNPLLVVSFPLILNSKIEFFLRSSASLRSYKDGTTLLSMHSV
jgi:hypothetical protein